MLNLIDDLLAEDVLVGKGSRNQSWQQLSANIVQTLAEIMERRRTTWTTKCICLIDHHLKDFIRVGFSKCNVKCFKQCSVNVQYYSWNMGTSHRRNQRPWCQCGFVMREFRQRLLSRPTFLSFISLVTKRGNRLHRSLILSTVTVSSKKHHDWFGYAQITKQSVLITHRRIMLFTSNPSPHPDKCALSIHRERPSWSAATERPQVHHWHQTNTVAEGWVWPSRTSSVHW